MGVSFEKSDYGGLLIALGILVLSSIAGLEVGIENDSAIIGSRPVDGAFFSPRSTSAGVPDETVFAIVGLMTVLYLALPRE